MGWWRWRESSVSQWTAVEQVSSEKYRLLNLIYLELHDVSLSAGHRICLPRVVAFVSGRNLASSRLTTWSFYYHEKISCYLKLWKAQKFKNWQFCSASWRRKVFVLQYIPYNITWLGSIGFKDTDLRPSYLARVLDSDRILYKMGGCREVVADEQFPVSIRYLVHLTHTSCIKHYKRVWCDDMDIK